MATAGRNGPLTPIPHADASKRVWRGSLGARHDNQPQDREAAADKRRQEAVTADERGWQRWMSEGDSGGQKATKAEARGGLPGSRQEVMTSGST